MLTLALLTTVSAHAVEPNTVSDVIFINWDADHPTITLVSNYDVATGVWNNIDILDDGDGVKVGEMWRFNVPSWLSATFDEIVLYPNTHRADTVTLFAHARVTVSLQPTQFDMSESRRYPNTVGRGGSHYVSFTNIVSCEGTACDYPNLTKLPRLVPRE